MQTKQHKTPEQIAYQKGQQAAADGRDWSDNPYDATFNVVSARCRKMWAAGYKGKQA